MKIFPLLFLLLTLAGCSDLPKLDKVDLVNDSDTSFSIACSKANCVERATDICHRQGYSRYDVIEQSDGDELGEGRGIVVQCKA